MMKQVGLVLFWFVAGSMVASAAAEQWTAPTPEELSMTSIPQVPGASAFYLYREEIADDTHHAQFFYVRLKVLTEGGKDFANVELPYASSAAGRSIDNISGRTIHPDGSIVLFTGKPFEKVVEKQQGFKIKEKIFTLPAVEVGSILEYRYRMHYDDGYFIDPDWYIQSNLFMRKAHYSWTPNHNGNITISNAHGDTLDRIGWMPILPVGVNVMANDTREGKVYEVNLADVPPLPKEEFMPPMDSLSYRVLFYYTGYKNAAEYWDKEGKRWSKERDKFVGPGPAVTATVNGLVAPGDSAEQKLRKLYAAVMLLENTDYTREHTLREERAAGLKDAVNTDDIVNRKRGSGDQLAELFVAMARAAGMKSYLMAVADRNRRIFIPLYQSLSQLDDYVAIVNVDGKDQVFDPGQRYCAFGNLAWNHALTGGLRQTATGTEVTGTSPLSYKSSHASRIADLTLDEHGSASGTVTLSYTGDTALHWRQEALRGDDTSLNANLKSHLEEMLPGGMDVRVTKVDNLNDADKPLTIIYEVKGSIGSPTGRRLLIVSNLFEINSKPKFHESKRELAVDMHYPSIVQDAVRLKLPPSLEIESLPVVGEAKIVGTAEYTTSTKKAPTSVTLYRNLTIGKTIFLPSDYADLRTFFGKLEAKDQEALVLTRAAQPAAGAN